MQVVFQGAFTTVFGWYAAFVFLRTGHLASAYVVHAFCNTMGFPRFGDISSHPQSGLIRGAFLLGIALFCAMLVRLTEPVLYANRSLSDAASNAYLQTARQLLHKGKDM